MRGERGPPPRTTPWDGRGDRRPARVCRRGRAAGRGSGRVRGTAEEIRAPRGRPRGSVSRGRAVGRGGRAEARRIRDQRPAIVALHGQTSDGEGEWMRPQKQPLGYVAADERRGEGMDAASGWPRRLAPHGLPRASHGNCYGWEDAATGQRRERMRGGRDGGTVIVAAVDGHQFCVLYQRFA